MKKNKYKIGQIVYNTDDYKFDGIVKDSKLQVVEYIVGSTLGHYYKVKDIESGHLFSIWERDLRCETIEIKTESDYYKWLAGDRTIL